MEYIRALCGLIAFIGFGMILGAAGGLDQGFLTELDFLKVAGCGFIMVTFGGFACTKDEK